MQTIFHTGQLYFVFSHLPVNVQEKSFALSEACNDGPDGVVVLAEGRFGVRAGLRGLVDPPVDVDRCSDVWEVKIMMSHYFGRPNMFDLIYFSF